jgi:hypothetical protein
MTHEDSTARGAMADAFEQTFPASREMAWSTLISPIVGPAEGETQAQGRVSSAHSLLS